MKKKFWILACILAAAILAVLCLPSQESSDSVVFYYPRKNFAYGADRGAIGSEDREVGHRAEDFPYLLALYLEGPMDPNLRHPFPGKTISQVQTMEIQGDKVTITLSDLGVGMRDSEFSLACACLARTCLEITGAEQVRITSGDRTVNMTMNNLLLEDESVLVQEATEERE